MSCLTIVDAIHMIMNMMLMTAVACPDDLGQVGYATASLKKNDMSCFNKNALLPLLSSQPFCATIF